MAPKRKAATVEAETTAVVSAPAKRTRKTAEPAPKPATRAPSARATKKAAEVPPVVATKSKPATVAVDAPGKKTASRSTRTAKPSTTAPEVVSVLARADPAKLGVELKYDPTLEERLSRQTCAVYVFGSGDGGQLGLGDEILQRKTPKQVPELSDIVDVAVGGMHTLALDKHGHIWSWGVNDQRALGRDAKDEEVFVPGRIDALADIPVAKVAAGDSISIALSVDGRVFGWGTFRNSAGIIGFDPDVQVQATPVELLFFRGKGVVDISAGSNHVIVLLKNGTAWAWGSGETGQLGRRFLPRSHSPLIPAQLRVGVYGKEVITSIHTGNYHSFVVTSLGRTFACGLNQYGQLALPKREPYFGMSLVSLLAGQKISNIAGGEHHSLVLLENGQILGFGRNNDGQLGLGTQSDAEPVPQLIKGPLESCKVKSIACGDFFSLAVTEDQKLYTWGDSQMGQLGHGDEEDCLEPTLLQAKTTRVIQAGGGGQHTVVLGVKAEQPAA